MELNSSEARKRAEASFKRKQEQARDGEKAWAEYQEQRRTLSEKIAHLKALRLAKEAQAQMEEHDAPKTNVRPFKKRGNL